MSKVYLDALLLREGFDIDDTQRSTKKNLFQLGNARVHTNAISFDYKIRKEDGGGGSEHNAQIAHPYCNSAIKN